MGVSSRADRLADCGILPFCASGLVLSFYVFFFIGGATGCRWPCVLALVGSIVGLVFDPLVRGGSHEERVWETVWYYGVGAGIGLLLGLVIKHIKDALPADLREETSASALESRHHSA